MTTDQHEAYVRIHGSDEFATLRKRFRGFAFAATALFMAWYLLYVLMSSFVEGFMNIQVVGNINVALIFGLLQFVSTFLLAVVYSRFSSRELDPIADKLRGEYNQVAGR
ncbi:MAG: DUF485 domain-containing protein [Nocardioidaceae bacterium]|nr:DUF485 domain-containing protein [Nocardioidaceae bacterium]